MTEKTNLEYIENFKINFLRDISYSKVKSLRWLADIYVAILGNDFKCHKLYSMWIKNITVLNVSIEINPITHKLY